MRKSEIIIIAIVAIVLAAIVVGVIIAGVMRNDKGDETDPPIFVETPSDTNAEEPTDTEPEQPTETLPPDTGTDEPDENKDDIHVGVGTPNDESRQDNPGVVGDVVIIPGVKEEGDGK